MLKETKIKGSGRKEGKNAIKTNRVRNIVVFGGRGEMQIKKYSTEERGDIVEERSMGS